MTEEEARETLSAPTGAPPWLVLGNGTTFDATPLDPEGEP